MANRIIQRHDTAANWDTHNPILAEGELGFISDQNNRYKIGDGVTPWKSLTLQGFNGNIVNETGDDEGAVMSQKGVTAKLTELESELERAYVRTGLELSGNITTNTEEYEVGVINNGIVDSGYNTYRTYTVTNTQSGNRFIFIRAYHNGNIGSTYSTVAVYDNATGEILFKSRLQGEQIVAIPSGTHAKFSQDSNFGVAYSNSVISVDSKIDAVDSKIDAVREELERAYVRTGLELSGNITTNTEEYEVGIIHNGIVNSEYNTYRTYTVTNTQSGNRFIFIRAYHNGNISSTYSTVAVYDSATDEILFKSRLQGEQIVAIPSGTHAKFSQDSNFGVAYSNSVISVDSKKIDAVDSKIDAVREELERAYVRTGLELSGNITTNTEEYEVGIIHNGVVNSEYNTYRTYTVTNTQGGNRFIFIRAYHNGNISGSFSTVAVYDNATGEILFKSRLQGEQIVAIPSGTHAKFSQDSNFGVAYSNSVNAVNESTNRWAGKKIVWLGTSIPAAGYPLNVAGILNANCQNEAVGSSMARRGQYKFVLNDLGDRFGVTGVSWQNICYSLTLSQEEKHEIFINWSTADRKANLKLKGYSDSEITSVKGYSELMSGNFYGEETDESDITDPSSKPSDIMADNYTDFRKKCYARSYNTTYNIEEGFGTIEGKIDKYLNWDNIPDLFVIDHGHNDNLGSDTNDEFINTPGDFHNRNTYVGAMNFIIQRILNFNPRQKILLISHYNRSSGYDRILDAQKNVQMLWGVPICDIADALQMNRDRVVTTNGYWDVNKVWHNSGYNGKNGYTGWRNTTLPENPRIENGLWVHDIPLLNAWMFDNLHPSTSDSKEKIAQVIAQYIQCNL